MQSHHLPDNIVAQIGHRSLTVAYTTLEVISSKPLGFSVICKGPKDQFCFIIWMTIMPIAMVVRNCIGTDLAQQLFQVLWLWAEAPIVKYGAGLILLSL